MTGKVAAGGGAKLAGEAQEKKKKKVSLKVRKESKDGSPGGGRGAGSGSGDSGKGSPSSGSERQNGGGPVGGRGPLQVRRGREAEPRRDAGRHAGRREEVHLRRAPHHQQPPALPGGDDPALPGRRQGPLPGRAGAAREAERKALAEGGRASVGVATPPSTKRDVPPPDRDPSDCLSSGSDSRPPVRHYSLGSAAGLAALQSRPSLAHKRALSLQKEFSFEEDKSAINNQDIDATLLAVLPKVSELKKRFEGVVSSDLEMNRKERIARRLEAIESEVPPAMLPGCTGLLTNRLLGEDAPRYTRAAEPCDPCIVVRRYSREELAADVGVSERQSRARSRADPPTARPDPGPVPGNAGPQALDSKAERIARYKAERRRQLAERYGLSLEHELEVEPPPRHAPERRSQAERRRSRELLEEGGAERVALRGYQLWRGEGCDPRQRGARPRLGAPGRSFGAGPGHEC
ncbi:hypothetical protein SKAU_G00376060 [Synaphobranchus kaupii]|uniref:Supervillin n=1 Tax=Synaphobranchus kaupii TaxID=118154 RepID=A0A9Q1ECQ3_SYNKA|nr:hypothetical protein SKAU_G00376060 [Synaphobranchus kaupii]